MRNRPGMLMLVLAFALCFVASGAAQQSQNLQITNGPVVESVTGNSAEIAWSTNVNSASVIKYGTDKNKLDQTAQAPWGGVTHRITLQNLQPNTTYYFQVESQQAQGTGTGATSGISQFKTSSK